MDDKKFDILFGMLSEKEREDLHRLLSRPELEAFAREDAKRVSTEEWQDDEQSQLNLIH